MDQGKVPPSTRAAIASAINGAASKAQLNHTSQELTSVKKQCKDLKTALGRLKEDGRGDNLSTRQIEAGRKALNTYADSAKHADAVFVAPRVTPVTRKAMRLPVSNTFNLVSEVDDDLDPLPDSEHQGGATMYSGPHSVCPLAATATEEQSVGLWSFAGRGFCQPTGTFSAAGAGISSYCGPLIDGERGVCMLPYARGSPQKSAVFATEHSNSSATYQIGVYATEASQQYPIEVTLQSYHSGTFAQRATNTGRMNGEPITMHTTGTLGNFAIWIQPTGILNIDGLEIVVYINNVDSFRPKRAPNNCSIIGLSATERQGKNMINFEGAVIKNTFSQNASLLRGNVADCISLRGFPAGALMADDHYYDAIIRSPLPSYNGPDGQGSRIMAVDTSSESPGRIFGSFAKNGGEHTIISMKGCVYAIDQLGTPVISMSGGACFSFTSPDPAFTTVTSPGSDAIWIFDFMSPETRVGCNPETNEALKRLRGKAKGVGDKIFTRENAKKLVQMGKKAAPYIAAAII